MGVTRLHDRWDQLNELFHQAIALPRDELDAFCKEACGDDDELREFLLQLVRSSESGDERFRRSVSKIAQDVAAQESLTGQRVGAYQIDDLIGRGGMGEVYLASRADGEFEKSVAIKIVRRKLATDDYAELVRTERQVMASMNHPAIPTLVDSGQLEDGRPYFICDFVDGLPIDAYCEQHGLSVDQRLELLGRVGAALQHAHNNLILHLDIKPDNILVQKDGSPSLLDFGVARLMDERDEGYRAFSPGYASPEQVRGERPSAASDIFSLGALMYHLLAGEPPFATPRFAPSETVLVERAKFVGRLNQPGTLSHVDGDIRAIVGKAMADVPADRYATVDAFLRDLKNHRHHLPVSARRRTFTYRSGRFLRRNRVAVTAVTLTVTAAFAAVAAVGIREAGLRRLAAQEAETARQVSRFLTEIFEVSDPGEAKGNSVTARELLDKAAGRITEDLDQQPLVASRLINTMGTVYQNLGLHEDAVALYEKGLALHESAATDDLTGLRNQLSGLGSAYTSLSRYEEAEKVFQRAFATAQRIEPLDLAALLDSQRALALVYMHTGRFEETVTSMRAAIERSERAGIPDRNIHASLLELAAIANRQMGRLEEVEADFLQAIALMTQELGPEHLKVGNLMGGLGNAYGAMERFEEAEDYMRRSLAIREKLLDPDHPRISVAYLNLGALYVDQFRYAEAEPHLKRAMAIQERTVPDDDVRLAVSRLVLGQVFEATGRPDEAEPMLTSALATFQAKLQPNHVFTGHAQAALALVYHTRGASDLANAAFVEALDVLAILPADDRARTEVVDDYALFLRAEGRDDEADRLESSLRDELENASSE